jgi:AcrR family transcriptional regulator
MPKQARSQERYNKILEMASNLFLQKGFDGTTTNEIADEAEVSIGSLYQYFENKVAIVEALAEGYVEALRELTSDILATDAADLPTNVAVDRLLDPIVQFHLDHPEFRKLWLGAEVSEELRTAMKAVDEELMSPVGALIKARAPGIPEARAQMIVRVFEHTVKSLLGLLDRADNPAFKAQAATETKRMLCAYLEDALGEQRRPPRPVDSD